MGHTNTMGHSNNMGHGYTEHGNIVHGNGESSSGMGYNDREHDHRGGYDSGMGVSSDSRNSFTAGCVYDDDDEGNDGIDYYAGVNPGDGYDIPQPPPPPFTYQHHTYPQQSHHQPSSP